jgi:RNA polymerase subunit RPABC4/transcription elongation factor Spt4
MWDEDMNIDKNNVQCNKCGNQLSKKIKFCQTCGTRNSKPFYLEWRVYVVVGLALLYAIAQIYSSYLLSSDYKMGTTTTSLAENTEASSVKTTTTIESTPINEKSIDDIRELDDESFAEFNLSVLVEVFEGVAEIEYDAALKQYSILFTDPRMALDVVLAQTGDSEDIERWNEIVDSTIKMSEFIAEVNSGYKIEIINTLNQDENLLVVMDGFVLFNYIDD